MPHLPFWKAILGTLCLVCLISCPVWGQGMIMLNGPNVPADFPLRMVDPKQANIPDLMDFESRPLSFTLKNISDKPLQLVSIMSGCGCLSFPKQVAGITLKPRQKVSFSAILYGDKLKAGTFERDIYIEMLDHPVAIIRCSGNRIDKISYSPARNMDLGYTFGDIPWQRSFTITHSFPAGQVELLSPLTSSESLSVALTRLNDTTYQVTVTPRDLPLNRGNHMVQIALPVKGIPNYGPVLMSVRYTVSKSQLMLKDFRHSIKSSSLDPSKKHTIISQIHYGTAAKSNPVRMNARREMHAKRKQIAFLPILDDELKAQPKSSRKFWEEVAKDITITPQATLPGVSVELVPQDDHIDVKTIFSENFFSQHPHGKIYCTISHKHRKLNAITIRW